MRDVLEVRPGAMRPEDLAEFERVLEPVVARIGHAARLVGPDGTTIELPEGIHDVLVSIIEHLKAGNGVTVIPMHAELTTVEAADLLNVSRPFLIKQIEAGVLPHHMVGTHRRLRLADVLAHRDRMDTQAAEALDANVLYGIEVTRNLAQRADLDADAIVRRLDHLNRALPATLVEVTPALIDAMPINESDRHVLALAVHVGAPTIVTENLRDFPTPLLAPHGVEAVSPDALTLAQVDLHPDGVIASIDAIAARRRRSPRTRSQIIDSLERYLPSAMSTLREHA